MNILMVTMSLGIGGAETHIVELARALVADGHSVTVASAGGVFVPELTASGVRHVEIPLHSRRPQHMWRGYRLLCRLLREESFDVLHAHARISGFVAYFAAKKFDVPFVTTFHYPFSLAPHFRLLTRVGERALAVSEDLKNYLADNYGMPREKITVTVNGIDTARYSTTDPALRAEVEKEFSLPAGDRIMAVTRLDKDCAGHVFCLMEAMPEIVHRRPETTLCIVGGGDVLGEITEAAQKANREIGRDVITVVGPRSDIARMLSAADVFVGVSRAAMEAMACRIPVVLSGAQGHLGMLVPSLEEEAVQTNFCCRTREAADSSLMASSVLALLECDGARRAELGEYGRDVVSRLYSVSRMAADARDLYERTLREHVYRRVEVLISGYYGFENAGDDALLSAIADGLRERGVRRIGALAKRGSCPATGVRAVSRFNMFAVLGALRRAKLLISGGGSLLQDVTSAQSLFYYTTVIRAAKAMGTPVMIYANGIGPIHRSGGQRRAEAAVHLADEISVREPTSATELEAMGISPASIRITADPIYRYATERGEAGDYIVLSLRETADGRDCEAVEDAAGRALIEICREWGLSAAVLPMQPLYDRAICTRAAQRLSEAGVEVREISAVTAEEMREVICGARAVVGMRLHALIFATAAAVPSLALSYDPKLDALMAYLGMEEYTLSAHGTDGAVLGERLRELLLRDEEISHALAERARELSALAEEDLDRAADMIRA